MPASMAFGHAAHALLDFLRWCSTPLRGEFLP
jgi:hypothetical protein